MASEDQPHRANSVRDIIAKFIVYYDQAIGGKPMNLNEIKSEMDHFVTNNGWHQPNSTKPQSTKNLAISLLLEASELLECFQWNDLADTTAVADELADVILYAAQLANVMDIDLDEAVVRKLASNQGRTWRAAGMEG